MGSIIWNDQYEWAREQISINELGPKPINFNQILSFGDFVYLKIDDDSYTLDQIPNVEASLISINPNYGNVIAYVGGKNFNESNFDRVRLSILNLDLVLSHLFIHLALLVDITYQV